MMPFGDKMERRWLKMHPRWAKVEPRCPKMEALPPCPSRGTGPLHWHWAASHAEVAVKGLVTSLAFGLGQLVQSRLQGPCSTSGPASRTKKKKHKLPINGSSGPIL